MNKRAFLSGVFALAIFAFSLSSAQAQYDNSAGNPLRSVLPGVGTTVGVDLEKELLSGTVLPVANGGTGSAIAFPLSVTLGGTGRATLTTNGIIYGLGTSAVGMTAQGTAGIPLIGAGASAPAFGTAVVGGGGTGATTLTSNGVLIGNGTSAITATAEGASGIPLIGVTGADPVFGTATVPGGGTGATSLTDHGVLVGSGAAAIDALAVGTNGQLLLGSTGIDPLFATMSGDATIDNAGALTLATVTVDKGGTGATSLTSNGVVIGNGTSAVTVTAEGATGIPLVGVTGADPQFAALTAAGAGAGSLKTELIKFDLSPNTGAAADSTVYRDAACPRRAGTITGISIYCQLPPTDGTDVIKILKNGSGGNTLLSTATFDANGLVANTGTTGTLTATGADLALLATDTIYAEYSAGSQTQDAIGVGVVVEYQPSDFSLGWIAFAFILPRRRRFRPVKAA